jgi:hypothetical protein
MTARRGRAVLVAALAAALPLAAPAAEQDAADDDGEAERAAAERALERALVQKGGLVVPPWGVELVPEVAFSHSDGSGPAAAAAGAVAFPARSEVLTAALTLRLGLPLDIQGEVSVPFVFARLTPTVASGSPPQGAPAGPAEGSGVGDVRVGVTWHALRSREHLPDVLLGGFWKSRSGKTAFDDTTVEVPFGTGVEQFGGTLALVKAVDPLVLLATATYAVSAPRWIPVPAPPADDGSAPAAPSFRPGWLEAGDEFGGSAGAVLAVSPEASLSFALEALHSRPLRVNGTTAFGSDRTSAVFRIGVATLASRRSFFQVNLGIGLTSDVPQFEISLATPLQF